jgi:hypothetical protein
MDQGTTTDTTLSTGKQQPIEITPVSSTGSESGKKTKQQPSNSTQKLTADGRAALPLQYA